MKDALEDDLLGDSPERVDREQQEHVPVPNSPAGGEGPSEDGSRREESAQADRNDRRREVVDPETKITKTIRATADELDAKEDEGDTDPEKGPSLRHAEGFREDVGRREEQNQAH